MSPEQQVTKPQLEEDLDGWTSEPPHALELVDALTDQLTVPGRWIVQEAPNDVTYRKPLVPHVAMLIAFLILLPLWPIVGALWIYIALMANDQRYRLTFTEGTGVTEEKLGRAARSYLPRRLAQNCMAGSSRSRGKCWHRVAHMLSPVRSIDAAVRPRPAQVGTLTGHPPASA